MDSADTFLYEPPKQPHVQSVRVRRGPQPTFRAPLNDILVKLVQQRRDLKRSPFLHTYSNLERGRIRLMVIRRGKFEDLLQVNLHSVSLQSDRQPHYEALSYEWGDGPPIHPIVLRDYTRQLRDIQDAKKRFRLLVSRRIGTKFFIRYNLFEALRHLRREDEDIKLWTDAVCINQSNNDEKTDQIARMADIYNTAYNVKIWLGGASERSDIAMDFINEVVQFEELKHILHHEESLQKRIALFELMCSRWFSRRWVIQELALARTASVHCGKKSVHWDDFADAISVFTTKLNEVRTEVQKAPKELNFKPEALSVVEALGARTLVKAASNLLRKDDNGEILERKSTLEYLMSTLVSFDSTDPRDTIYALLAIARSNPHKTLKPDYKKSLLEVHTEFVKYCVESSNSLDIICRHWAPANTNLIIRLENSGKVTVKTTLPSWIRQLDESAFGTPEKIFRGRKNADTLVGSQRIYNASGRYTADHVQFGIKPSQEIPPVPGLIETYDGSLTVRGFVLGRIHALSPRVMSGILPQEALEMLGWSYSLKDEDLTIDKVPDRLWRTLVANRDPHGQPPEPFYRRACLYSLQREDASGDVHTRDLVSASESPDEMVNFLKRVQNVVWNRKVFRGGQNDELFGLAPRSADPGDLVCVLYGCSVPVILREQKNPWSSGILANPPAPIGPGPSNRIEGSREPSRSRRGIAWGKRTRTHASSSVLFMDPASPINSVSSPGTRGAREPASGTTSRKRRRTEAELPQTTDAQGITAVEPSAETQTADPQPGVVPHAFTDAQAVQGSPPTMDLVVSYKLIGECYVDGRMDGEALDNYERDKIEQDLRLV